MVQAAYFPSLCFSFLLSHQMTDTVGYAPVIKLPRSKSSSSNFPTRRDKSDHLVSDILYIEGLSRTDQITEDDLMDLMQDCQPLEYVSLNRFEL